MDIKQTLQESYHFRHACKIFSQKKISDDDFSFILNSARMAPTSFGMEGVRLSVITNQTLKEKLKPLCWNQDQIDSCSHLVVLKTRTHDLEPNTQWVQKQFQKRNLPQEALQTYLKVYENFHKNLGATPYEWGARQAYIFLEAMLLSSSLLQIDSCPIEGFEKEGVEKLLEIDTLQEEVVLLCAFGYRKNPQTQKIRLSCDEICEFIR